MIEHPGFLQDIIANPDDDAPRLIYAEWLEDHGRPGLARLIRRQVANPDDVLDIAAGDGLYGDDGEEIYRCPSFWGRTPAGRREKWLIRRGFIETVETTLADALDHLPALVRRHPIRKVRATDREPFLDDASFSFNAWTWFLNLGDLASMSADGLPREVFDLLLGGVASGASWRDYDSPEAARADLSQALLVPARTKEPVTC